MTRPSGVFKTGNLYADLLDSRLYAEVPKAVFAAIAISALMCGDPFNEDDGDPNARIVREWLTLSSHNDIVPQRPPAWAQRFDEAGVPA